MNKVSIVYEIKESYSKSKQDEVKKENIAFSFKNKNGKYSIEAEKRTFILNKEDFYFLLEKEISISYERKSRMYSSSEGYTFHIITIVIKGRKEQIF